MSSFFSGAFGLCFENNRFANFRSFLFPWNYFYSFLPGQEAGNVDVVLERGFGEFNKKPSMIGEIVTSWLQDKSLLESMSQKAMEAGNPYAADEIVEDIGRQTVAWMNLNEK